MQEDKFWDKVKEVNEIWLQDEGKYEVQEQYHYLSKLGKKL